MGAAMTRLEFLGRWTQRADELKHFGASVDGHHVISEFLGELERLFREEEYDGRA